MRALEVYDDAPNDAHIYVKARASNNASGKASYDNKTISIFGQGAAHFAMPLSNL
jgi:hypothetical protein